MANTLRSIMRRRQQLDAEIKSHKQLMDSLTKQFVGTVSYDDGNVRGIRRGMTLADRRISKCVQGQRSWHPCRWTGLMAPTAHSY